MVVSDPDFVLERIHQLEEADKYLRERMIDLERVLRADYEGKIHSAVVDLKGDIKSVADEVASSRTDLKQDVKDVKDGLTLQNRTALGFILSAACFALIYIFLHFYLHIG